MTTDSTLEKAVEAALVRELDKRRVLHRKLNGESYRAWPDRIILLPDGGTIFVELKRPSVGAKVTPAQQVVHDRLQALGFPVFVLFTAQMCREFAVTHIDPP